MPAVPTGVVVDSDLFKHVPAQAEAREQFGVEESSGRRKGDSGDGGPPEELEGAIHIPAMDTQDHPDQGRVEGAEQSPSRGILAVQPVPEYAIRFAEDFDEPGQLGNVELAVGIGEEDELEPRCFSSRSRQRRHTRDSGRVSRSATLDIPDCKPFGFVLGTVGAAVADDDDLVRFRAGNARCRSFSDDIGEVLSLVVTRKDDGKSG